MSPEPPVVLLMGPTASGKSRLALELAARCDVEIVSVDSAQVYRGMDIGTAKPTAQERAQVSHHLLDILDPAEAYSAARFAADARRLIVEIRSRGRIPLLVGGTMLYFKALDEGLSALPSADSVLRQRLAREAQTLGWPALHARLAAADPVTAARLHPNDQQRIQRALEILEATGIAPSVFHARPRASSRPEGAVLRVALVPGDRAVLHRRIEQRFDAMMALGFVDEVRRLHARGDLHAELPSIRAVGYRQLWTHLQGDYGLDEAVARGKAATRQYAKRQLTWLRAADGPMLRLDPDAGAALESVRQALKRVGDAA
jgi:tRNA dimethylallyltransferase